MFEEQKTTTSLFLIRSLQDLSQEMRPKKILQCISYNENIFTNFIPGTAM